MRQDSADVVERELAELVRRLGVVEGVLLALEQRLVRVHAGAVLAEDRLRHERGVQPEVQRHLADHEAEGADIVRRGQSIGILEIDLVLPGRHLVVRRLHLEPHLLQTVDDGPAAFLALIDGGQIEVTAAIVRLDGGVARVIHEEQEELRLRPGHHGVARLAAALDGAPQREPRTSGERRLVRVVDVADQTRHPTVLVLPRKDPQRVQIRLEQHVGFLDAYETLDGRTVEHDLTGQRLLELAVRDFHVLVVTLDIGEHQPQEADLLLAQGG
jgi:hypothetical protein